MTGTVLFLITVVGVVGVGTIVWSAAGIARSIAGRNRRSPHGPAVTRDRVAIIIAAHNEELVINKTLDSALAQVPASQVFVASDGSTDATSDLARDRGANVLDLNPNRGKAGAIVEAIRYFNLEEEYEVVLLLDADTVLSDDYLESGLALFGDADVVTVAGRASTIYFPPPATWLGRVLVTYRQRVYFAVQYLLKYGQASRFLNVVTIVPGFASMYRTRVLGSIDIAAPGLSIEDYNMTFEIHAKSLGRIAFSPGSAVAYTQDPATLRDYTKQVRRWSLGFWQTLFRHGIHARTFFLVTWISAIELIVSCVVLLLAPILVLVSAAVAGALGLGWHPADFLVGLATAFPAWVLAVGVLVPDFLLSCGIALASRQPRFFAFALVFPILRITDAALCLVALWLAAFPRTSRASSGAWKSPERRSATGS